MRRLADLLVEALIARPIFTKASPAVFHADPHAGNLFLTDDHRLAILDWSLVGSLGEPERVALVQALLAAMTLDAEHVLTTLEALAERPPDRPALRLGRLRLARRPAGAVAGAHLAAGPAGRGGPDRPAARRGRPAAVPQALHTLEGVEADIGAGEPGR